jgi:TonB family protein
VRLAREEVVDELTICVTGRRRTYLEALLAFADAAPFAPGAAFARRRHLFRRMTLISKEAVMSSRRIALSCAVLVFGVVAGSWSAVKAFPLAQQAPGIVAPAAQAQTGDAGPLERSTKPITPENPIPRRTYSVIPPHPGGAEDANTVVVTLRVTINSNGRVGELRATGRVFLSGDGQFAGERAALVRAQRNAEIQAARDRGVIIADSATMSPFSSSDVFIKSAIDAVRQWVFDPPADAPISFDVTLLFARGSETRLVAYGGPLGVVGGLESRPRERATGAAGDVAPPPPPPAPLAPWTREGATIQNAVRIGGAILPPVKTKDVRPEYSPIAMSSHVEGVVILEAVIGTDGRVDRVSVLRSIPLLDQSAMDAVKEWEFTPTLMNGTPVPVIMTVSINFTLK